MLKTHILFDYPDEIPLNVYDDFDWGYRILVSEVIKAAVTGYLMSKTSIYSGLSKPILTQIIAATTARLIEDKGLLLNSNPVTSAIIEHFLNMVVTTLDSLPEPLLQESHYNKPESIRSSISVSAHLSYYSLDFING